MDGRGFFVAFASLFSNANPVIMKRQPAVQFDLGHVTLDTTIRWIHRASNLAFVIRLVTIQAILNVLGWLFVRDRTMRVVAGRAFELPI